LRLPDAARKRRVLNADYENARHQFSVNKAIFLSKSIMSFEQSDLHFGSKTFHTLLFFSSQPSRKGGAETGMLYYI
jgi:hypothetical protein